MVCKGDTCSNYRFPVIAYVFIVFQFIQAVGAFIVSLIIPIYMTSILGLSSSTATSLYHAKNALAYLFNIFGALLADGVLGRARSYLIFMPIDLCVMVALAIMSVYVVTPGILTAIFLLSIIGGLTSPAIRALIPDQIPSDRKDMLSTYMHFIYLINNIGALISAYVAPILHKDIYCFGMECYPLNFAIYLAAGFTSFAIVFSAIQCKKVVVHEATENLLLNLFRAVTLAIKQRIKLGPSPTGSEWLDYANEKFGREFVRDVKAARNLCVFVIAQPLFWLVFEQMSSIWTLQARFMDGRVTKNFDVKADQIQTLNPLLVIVLIPLFEALLYPLMNRINFKVPYRIGLGQLFTAAAALSMLFLQLKIDVSLQGDLPDHGSKIRLYSLNNFTTYSINNSTVNVLYRTSQLVNIGNSDNFSVYCNSKLVHSLKNNPNNKTSLISVVIGASKSCIVRVKPIDNPQNKGGYANVTGINVVDDKKNPGGAQHSSNYTIELEGVVGINKKFIIDPNSQAAVKCGIGEYKAYLRDGKLNPRTYQGNVDLKPAETIALVIYKHSINNEITVDKLSLVHFPLISIFWQVIPYVLLTIGEILFNVNNSIFLYGEAPASMKAMLLSVNYLCVGIGNILILAISQATRNISWMYMFLMCSVVTTLSGIITCFLAYRYLRMKATADEIEEENSEHHTTNIVTEF